MIPMEKHWKSLRILIGEKCLSPCLMRGSVDGYLGSKDITCIYLGSSDETYLSSLVIRHTYLSICLGSL